MTGDQGFSLLYGVLALMLIASGLFARRLPLGPTLKMVALWVAIFGFIYILFLFRGEGQAIWNRIVADVSGDRGTQTAAGVQFRKGDGGHFWVTAELNGKPVRFMVDSGATITTISPRTAASVGIVASGQPVMIDTANGTVLMRRARGETLRVGSIDQRDVPLIVSANADDDFDVLGNSFLSRLRGWRVEGDTLTLQP